LEGNQCSVWALKTSPSKALYHQLCRGSGLDCYDQSIVSSSFTTTAEEDDYTVIVSGGKDKDTGERVLRIWSLAKGTTVRTLRGHSNYITSIAFSPSGDTIASGSFDNKLMTHRVAEREREHYPKQQVVRSRRRSDVAAAITATAMQLS
jgi:WD40 repeat protein